MLLLRHDRGKGLDMTTLQQCENQFKDHHISIPFMSRSSYLSHSFRLTLLNPTYIYLLPLRATCPDYLKRHDFYRAADKSLARQGRKQVTATKL